MSEHVQLIDTSTLSEVMRQHDGGIQEKARRYLTVHGRFTFSILTRFEILRGLQAKGAVRQLEHFEAFCSKSEVLPLDDAIIVKASEIYGHLHRRGLLIDDIDILIAATALVRELSVITENVAHFTRVPDLRIESWKQ